jgi:ribonuclease PH
MSGDAKVIEVQATAEGEPFTRELLDVLLDLAGEGIDEITEAQRATLEAAVA